MSELKKAYKSPQPILILKYVYTIYHNNNMATAIAIATTSIILTLAMGFLFYLEVYKINKQVSEIQEQIHYLNNEVSRLKQQAKKKYYPAQNKRQVIKG